MTAGFLIASIVTAMAAPAHACSCMYYQTLPEFVENTDLIFRGQVTKIPQLDSYGFNLKETDQTTFDVLKAYKGDLSKRVSLTHSTSGATCGVNFKKDQTGLFYAVVAHIDYEEVLYTGLCVRPRFTEEQVIAYIETGLDTSKLDYECERDIEKAYEKQLETHLLELDNKACEAVVPLNDQLYRD